MSARVINHKRKYDHISKDIQELHWLKISEQIQYKVAVLTFECVKGDTPIYLKDVVNTTHNHALHSTTNNYLPVSMSKLSQVHKSSFSIMAGRIWNDLPFNLNQQLVLMLSKLVSRQFYFVNHITCKYNFTVCTVLNCT